MATKRKVASEHFPYTADARAQTLSLSLSLSLDRSHSLARSLNPKNLLRLGNVIASQRHGGLRFYGGVIGKRSAPGGRDWYSEEMSRPTVHPVEAPPPPTAGVANNNNNGNGTRARMKDVQGTPGTGGGLGLRIFQFVFAVVSLSVMGSTNDFPTVTAFR